MHEKKTLLLTNDDGIHASGIKKLYSVLKNRYSVIIVAPSSEQSGVSHSFTYNKPITFDKIKDGYAEEMYSVNGYPADCVKLALTQIVSSQPSVVVSGLNIGENSGISAHYSGTVAAAREGSFWKIKSIAFSICDAGQNNYDKYLDMVPQMIETLLEGNSLFLNVNFPSCDYSELKGIKITRQSCAFFDDNYTFRNVLKKDEIVREYHIVGEKIAIEKSDDFDSRALINNWITVTPLSIDATAYNEIEHLRKIFIKGTYNV